MMCAQQEKEYVWKIEAIDGYIEVTFMDILQLFFPSYNEQPGPLEKQFYPHFRSRIMSK